MLADSETAVRDAIREIYAGRVTGEEIQIDGAIKRLVLQLGSQAVVVNLSKMTTLYETGTSLAAIKTVSRFETSDLAVPPRDKQPLQRTGVAEKRSWFKKWFGRGAGR